MTGGYGVIATTWDVSEIGRVRFDLFVQGTANGGDTAADDATRKVSAITRWLDDAMLCASRGDEWVELVVARGNTEPVYFDVTGGSVRPAGGADRFARGEQQIVRV